MATDAEVPTMAEKTGETRTDATDPVGEQAWSGEPAGNDARTRGIRRCVMHSGLLSAAIADGTLSLSYSGNMGSSMVNVDRELRNLGLFAIDRLRSLPSFVEEGNPDYAYSASVSLGDLSETMLARVRSLAHKGEPEVGFHPVPRHDAEGGGMLSMLGDVRDVAAAMADAPSLGTADPRFWVVQQRHWSLRPAGSGDPFVWAPGEVETYSLGDFAEQWMERAWEEAGDDVTELSLGHGCVARVGADGSTGDVASWEVEVTDESAFVEDIEEGVAGDGYEIVWMDWEYETVANTLFLTLDACKEHIEANSYHYDHPRAFCMRAWRSPDVARLWKALKGIDWEAVMEAVGKDGSPKA